MESRGAAAVEKDRAIVQAMRLAGEPLAVIEDYLMCLDISEAEREELRRVAEEFPEVTNGDVIEMNPLTIQPQRSKPR